MTAAQNTPSEIEELLARLTDAEETLEAIRTGAVDAVIVSGPQGEQVVSLSGDGTDHPRRHAAHDQAAERAADRTARLQAVTAALAGTLTAMQVVTVVVEQGLAALNANGGSIALLNEAGPELAMLRFVGYPQELTEAWSQSRLSVSALLAEAVRSREPVLIESLEALVARYPELAGQIVSEHQAFASIPLIVEGRAVGGMGLSWHEPQHFSAEDREFMLALGRQCALALERARLYEAEQRARAEAEKAQQRETFLAEASSVLASSLDYETTLARVAQLAVPHMADWCTVHVLEDNDSLQQLALAHADPAKARWAQELQKRYPPDASANVGVSHVLRTGKPECLSVISHNRCDYFSPNLCDNSKDRECR